MRYMHVIAAGALLIPTAGFAQVSGGTTGTMPDQTMPGQTMPGQTPGQTMGQPGDTMTTTPDSTTRSTTRSKNRSRTTTPDSTVNTRLTVPYGTVRDILRQSTVR